MGFVCLQDSGIVICKKKIKVHFKRNTKQLLLRKLNSYQLKWTNVANIDTKLDKCS